MTNESLSFSTRLWFAWVCLVRVMFDESFAARVWRVQSGDALGGPKELPVAGGGKQDERKAQLTRGGGAQPLLASPKVRSPKEDPNLDGDDAKVEAKCVPSERAAKEPAEGVGKPSAEAEGVGKPPPEAEGAKPPPEAEAKPPPEVEAKPPATEGDKPLPQLPDSGALVGRESSDRGASSAPGQHSRDVEAVEAAEAAAVRRTTAVSSALDLLGLLQRDGRLIDFLEQDITSFSDADVGAAALSRWMSAP